MLMARRMDGIDPWIMIGSGGLVGHTAMAMRDSAGELWVLESQSGWYWGSDKKGVQKNKFSDWLEYAKSATYEVVWLPIREDIRAKLNVTKAWDFFNTIEGLPYGVRNFWFSNIDTVDQNYFAPITGEYVPLWIKYM